MTSRRPAVLALAALLGAVPAWAQSATADTAGSGLLRPIAKDTYLVQSPLGNLVVQLAGVRGWVIVGPEDQVLRSALQHELAIRSRLPVRVVVVTASPGLEHDRDAGWASEGALVIAEEHAAGRMIRGLSADYPRGDAPAAAPTGPALGFSEVQQIHVGGQDIHLVRQKPGSTDSDIIAHFEGPGVMYLGDSFIADGYPTVDEAHGGDFAGLIETSAKFMTWDAKTKFVPGRGNLSSPADLREYHDMLVGVRDRVKALHAAGRPLAAIVASRPTAPWDARWGKAGPSVADALVTAAYRSITMPRK